MQLYDAVQLIEYDAADFDDFSRCDLLAIDNLDRIAGNPGWENCFYQVINRCRDGEFRLLYSLAQRPEDLSLGLADLRSRLQWGLLMQLPSSDDDQVRRIVLERARLLGIELSDDVMSYLLTHHSRNLAAQMDILQTLDGASLADKRRVTIPLVKRVLG